MRWKRVILVICMFLFLSGAAQAVTIEGMELWGGSVSGPNWFGNGQIWNTFNDGRWVLGVSQTANGALLNNATTTELSGLALGNYWLYASPTSLGTYAKLDVYLSDSTVTSAIFEVNGSAGTANFWTRWSGNPDISLGWAEGTADKVRPGESMVADGTNDFYLQAQVGQVATPLPATVWLLGAGLACLAGLRRRQG